MKVISLINMKGGVAKTTLAINIADCLVNRHNSSVLIIDVDPQFNATQCLMSPEEYVSHLKLNGDTILRIFDRANRVVPSTVENTQVIERKKLEDIEVVNIKKSLDLLPGNLELYRLEMAPGEGRENRLNSYISKLREVESYDFVIIDTPPTPSVWMTSALIASDNYLIPVKADPISLTGIDLLKSIVAEKKENFNLSISCAGLVLTISEPNTNVYQNAKKNLEADSYWKNYLYTANLPKRIKIAQNQLDKITILDSDNPEAKTAITRITQELLDRIEE